MSQNYPPYGGGDNRGQGRGQGPGFRRGRDRRRNRTRGVRQGQRDAVEAEDFFAPREPQREPVYRYGDRHFPTEQDARRQRDQPAFLHNHQQPLHEPREYNNDFLGPYEEEPVHYRRPPPPEQISGYGYQGSHYPPEQVPGYGHRGSQNPLEHYPRYGDRGNQPPPLTPGQLYGRNQRGFTPPGQSSNSQHGKSSYHGPRPHTSPVRVPQAQNRPPIQAPIQEPSRANTQVSLPEISGDAIEPAGKHDPNISKMYRRIPGGYSGSFDSYESALIALKQTLGPDEIARGKWRITSGEEYPREDPRIKKRRIQELESTIVSRPLFELLPPATPEEQARIDRARAARAARLQAINAVPNIPAQPAGPSCGNCKNDSHVVAKCNKPQSDGLIHGCAICNADDHSTWACGEFPRGDGKELDQLRELVFKRMNQPPLQGKYWYPLMYSYMQAHPFTEVPGLPWTTEFSQRYHKDSRLQSRLRYDMDNDELFTVDPKTRTWQAAVAHYGDPRQRQSKSKTKQ